VQLQADLFNAFNQENFRFSSQGAQTEGGATTHLPQGSSGHKTNKLLGKRKFDKENTCMAVSAGIN